VLISSNGAIDGLAWGRTLVVCGVKGYEGMITGEKILAHTLGNLARVKRV